MADRLFDGVLQIGDDALVIGQRLCEWTGKAPTIELDIALSNLALDLVGQATLLLEYAGEVEGRGRDADRLAFHRDASDFRNCLLVEQPNGDFARTMLRHYLFGQYSLLLFQQLEKSDDRRLAAIAAKSVKELRYHVEFASEWVVRLGDGSDESQQRMEAALVWLWRFVDDLLLDDEDWSSLASDAIVPMRADLRPDFLERVEAVFDRARLAVPGECWGIIGGRQGRHSEHLSHMLGEMQVIPRAHPDAHW